MPTPPAKPGDATPLVPSETPDVPGPMPATRASMPEPANQHHAEPVHPHGGSMAPPGIVPESDVRVHSPAAAAPQPQRPVDEGLGELPRNYGDARLVALVRDPATLYVYWDFSAQQVEQSFAQLGPSRAVIRLFNARSGNTELLREEEVQLEARSWYLRDLTPGSEVRAELWAIGEKGARLLRAARPVRLPPAWESDQLEAFYLRLSLEQPLPKDGLSPTGRTLQYGGSQPSEWDRRVQQRAAPPSSQGTPLGSSPAGGLPWSMTHLPDLDGKS